MQKVVALTTIARLSGDLASFKIVSSDELNACHTQLHTVHIPALKPELISLVDAWCFTDSQLGHSAIGAHDGDIYQRLFDYAQKEPLNTTPLDQQPLVAQIRRLTHRKMVRGFSRL